MRRVMLWLSAALSMSLIAAAFDQATITITVVDDLGQGVKSVMWKLTRSDPPQKTRLGQTADDGTLPFSDECQRGERLLAEPVSGAVYNPQDLECPLTKSPTRVLVTRVQYATNLLNNAKRAEDTGEVALAALLYNDLYHRTTAADPQASAEYRVKSIRLFGVHLGVNVKDVIVIDAKGSKGHLSPTMFKAISGFQSSQGLSEDGILNFSTMSAAAGVDSISPYLFKGIPPGH